MKRSVLVLVVVVLVIVLSPWSKLGIESDKKIKNVINYHHNSQQNHGIGSSMVAVCLYIM